jgi:hypothetical protein
MTDDWDDDDLDDEEEPELPVIPAGDLMPPPPPVVATLARHRKATPHETNTKATDADEARARALAEAKGAAPPEPADWRDELVLGNRHKAAGLLSKPGSTHNASTGFGLA